MGDQGAGRCSGSAAFRRRNTPGRKSRRGVTSFWPRWSRWCRGRGWSIVCGRSIRRASGAGRLDKPEHFDRVVQSWDTANKATELSDFSVCTTWGIKDKQNYLLHVFRKRLEFPDLKREVRHHQVLFSAGVVLIEDKASGTQLIQELNRDGLSAVTRYKPEADKVMRMHAQTAAIEDGRVLLPKEA